MRKRFIQLRGELVEVTPDYVPEPRANGILIIKDIEPYRAIAADKDTGKRPVINSRKQHREFLKRNDLVELGNEPLRLPKRDWNDVPSAPMVSIDEMRRRGFVDESY